MKKTIIGIANGKKRSLVIVAAIAAVMMIGGASAYFTSTDSADNTWTVGTVTIDLHEDEYDAAEDEREGITPNMDLTKDPVITNTGDNPAYVFVQFSVPKANVKVASQDGATVSQELQELFDFTINSGWSRVSAIEGDVSNTYIYAYGSEAECQVLAPEASTPVLFKDSKITFKNIVEGQGLEGTTLEIPVEAYGIQTTDITAGDVNTPSAVWSVLNSQVSQNHPLD